MRLSRFPRLGDNPGAELIDAANAGSASVDANAARIALDATDYQRTPCRAELAGDAAWAWTYGREVRQSELAVSSAA